jgi:hypothetical protein
MPGTRHPRTPVLLIVWLTLAWLVFAALVKSADVQATDFHAFYQSGLLFRGAQPNPADRPSRDDLNTPILAAVVAPLTFLSMQTAFYLWTAIGAGALALTLRAVHAERRVPVERLLWIAGGCSVLAPGHAVWSEGQVTWLLLYPVTAAWLRSSHQPRAAGSWLGLAIAIKPPLALIMPFVPGRTSVTAVLVAAILVGFDLLAGGVAAWLAWLGALSRINWLPHQWNASLWGMAARIHAPQLSGAAGMTDIGLGWRIAVIAASASLAWQVFRSAGDRRWMLAILWGILVSPLGWIYYLPLTIGPLAVLWRPTWGFRTCTAFFVLPLLSVTMFAMRFLSPALVGSTSALTVLAAWFVVSRQPRSDVARQGLTP